jgi:uncharacterized protein YhfF
MTIEPNLEKLNAFWESCRTQLPQEKIAHIHDTPEAWGFGDGPRMADELGALVLEGRKTATCGILWEYESENEALPKSGDFSIILNGAGQPMCLIETTEVRVVPFDQVDAQFAYEEGEDDRTLESWRREHWKFFTRYLTEIDRQPAMDMPLVCERFRLVLKADDVVIDRGD